MTIMHFACEVKKNIQQIRKYKTIHLQVHVYKSYELEDESF